MIEKARRRGKWGGRERRRGHEGYETDGLEYGVGDGWWWMIAFFFFKEKAAIGVVRGLVGSEMFIMGKGRSLGCVQQNHRNP